MEKKVLDNIGDFFSPKTDQSTLTPEERWEDVFSGWIVKIDQEKQMLNLFELKLWLESLEEFHASVYLENLVFKYLTLQERNYFFYLFVFYHVTGRMAVLLKELDFKKDKFFLNFEEYIVDKALEDSMGKSFPYLKELHSPESWFNNFRIFVQNFRYLISEIQKSDTVNLRAFSSFKKLYHRELIFNPMLISLLKKQFIPKMDKIYQPDISQIIAKCSDKNLRKVLGIFFVLSFRILKINNFIELNLTRGKYLELSIPLILSLRKELNTIQNFAESTLLPALKNAALDEEKTSEIIANFENLKMENKKIFEGELPLHFDDSVNKLKKRKVIKNIIIIAEVAIQELIENVSKLFNPDISGNNIFENYISRKQKSIEVKKKLIRLHTKINDYFLQNTTISPSEIFFDVNLFMETDLNFLLYKDWNEFLSYYDNLNRTNLSSEFEPTLRAFHSFLTRILKEIVSEKK